MHVASHRHRYLYRAATPLCFTLFQRELLHAYWVNAIAFDQALSQARVSCCVIRNGTLLYCLRCWIGFPSHGPLKTLRC